MRAANRKNEKKLEITQSDVLKLEKVMLMNKAFDKCTRACLEPRFYNSSVPTPSENRCLAKCYNSSIITSALHSYNMMQISDKYKKYLEDIALDKKLNPLSSEV